MTQDKILMDVEKNETNPTLLYGIDNLSFVVRYRVHQVITIRT